MPKCNLSFSVRWNNKLLAHSILHQFGVTGIADYSKLANSRARDFHSSRIEGTSVRARIGKGNCVSRRFVPGVVFFQCPSKHKQPRIRFAFFLLALEPTLVSTKTRIECTCRALHGFGYFFIAGDVMGSGFKQDKQLTVLNSMTFVTEGFGQEKMFQLGWNLNWLRLKHLVCCFVWFIFKI